MKTTPKSDLPDSIDPNLNLEKIKKECESLVKSRQTFGRGGNCLVPFVDVAIDAGLLTQLLPEISERFGLLKDRKPAVDLKNKDFHVGEMKDRAVDFAGLMATEALLKRQSKALADVLLPNKSLNLSLLADKWLPLRWVI